MKMKVWTTILVATICGNILADQPATESAPAQNAPAAQPVKSKPSKTTPASELRTVPLVPGPATVVAHRVNVRGRAGLIGEVIARLTNGEPVTVIEEVTLKNSKANEPSAWAKIQLPAGAHVWVHSSFIDR
ncbi:MAG: SH3 domain-containing protein, partial [Verrucomicrobiota bacterium]